MAVLWPESERPAVIARWPRLAAFLGSTWDECWRRTERYCVLVDNNGVRTVLLPGDVGGFEAFLAVTGGAEPSQRDLLAYPDLSTVDGSWMTSWPLAGKASCWCRLA